MQTNDTRVFVTVDNRVHFDRRKILINRENELRTRWPDRWGFYAKQNVETVRILRLPSLSFRAR